MYETAKWWRAFKSMKCLLSSFCSGKYGQFSCSIGNHTLSSQKLNQVLVLHMDKLDLKWWHHIVSEFIEAMLKWVVGSWPNSAYYDRNTILYQNLCYTLFTKQQRRLWQKLCLLNTQLLCTQWYFVNGNDNHWVLLMYITMARPQLTRWYLSRRCCWTLFITLFLHMSCW